MTVRLLRLLVAAPLVVLLGAAMARAAWPEGDVTARDRELVARLTRGGLQRLEGDTLDVGDSATTAAARPSPLACATRAVPPRPVVARMLDTPHIALRAGRPSSPPERGRAPPRR
jgi:hypothetical protein